MYNKVIMMGRIVNDLELRSTPAGASVLSFRIAVDRRFQTKGEDRKSDFFNVVAWRNEAEFISRYFAKGRMILIEGELQNRSYQDKNGNAYQYDLRIFCHQRIPEYLVQQLAEPSAEPLKYINFGSYQLTTVSKRRVRLPSGNLCSITNQCISRSHIHSPLSEFIKIVNITLHHHIIYLFRSLTVLIRLSQQ